MEILGWIVADLVILGFGLALISRIYYLVEGPVISTLQSVDGQVTLVREIPTPDKSWPEYTLTVEFELQGRRFRRRFTLSQGDFKRLLPDAFEDRDLSEGSRNYVPTRRSSVPLLVDGKRPSRVALDSHWLAEGR